MRFNKHGKTLERLASSDLKANAILERSDLQQAIINSWTDFKKELGELDLYLIGEEVVPHDDINNRIDILAYSAEENIAVVIELKRGKHKMQLLQSISYAAMISSWTSEKLLSEAQRQNVPELQDLEDLLKNNELRPAVRIILFAEQFDPEVMISADWLFQQYKVDIMAFGINVFRRKEEIYFSLTQKYPLPELSDVYALRTLSSQKKGCTPDISWEEVATSLQYDWGAYAIALCREYKEGDAKRRRFGQIRSNWEGFNWISINFRRAYVNVYLKGNPEGVENIIQSKFKNTIEIGTWRDGYSFLVKTKEQFSELVRWLELK